MKRLTGKCSWEEAEKDLSNEPKYKDIWERLNKIENNLPDDYDLDRLLELAKADKEGRAVMFPCRPSDTVVYQLRDKRHTRGPGVQVRHLSCARVWNDGFALEHQGQKPCIDKEFGKTWFLDEETAKQAFLKKMKDR